MGFTNNKMNLTPDLSKQAQEAILADKLSKSTILHYLLIKI